MIHASINLVAVGVAALASFILGSVWFTVIFRQLYLNGLGKTAEQLAKGPSTLEASVLRHVECGLSASGSGRSARSFKWADFSMREE